MRCKRGWDILRVLAVLEEGEGGVKECYGYWGNKTSFGM